MVGQTVEVMVEGESKLVEQAGVPVDPASKVELGWEKRRRPRRDAAVATQLVGRTRGDQVVVFDGDRRSRASCSTSITDARNLTLFGTRKLPLPRNSFTPGKLCAARIFRVIIRASMPGVGVQCRPFTAPLASPAMKSFWSTKNRTTTGRTASSVPAISTPYGVSYSASPIMLVSPIGSVYFVLVLQHDLRPEEAVPRRP